MLEPVNVLHNPKECVKIKDYQREVMQIVIDQYLEQP